jgi:hypothetical protein
MNGKFFISKNNSFHNIYSGADFEEAMVYFEYGE